LLQAGTELFAERGYAGTGISAICERAGVARTALYWHFGNKEGLLAAVLEAVTTTWIEQLQKATSVEGQPADRLDRLIREWRAVALERPELLRLPMLAQLEVGRASRRVRESLARVWRHAERALVEGIEDILGRSLPDLDLVAHTVVTLLQGALLRQIADPDERRLDRNLAELRRTLLLLIWARFPYEERLALVKLGAGSEFGVEPTAEEEETGG
jgi:AcrR family transcriptional regulator